jgi:hypothetical protein
MMIETCLATVLLVCVGLSALAQERPNFSGEWTLNRQASTLSSGADAAQSGLWQIEHREPTFRHKASFVNGKQAGRMGVRIAVRWTRSHQHCTRSHDGF